MKLYTHLCRYISVCTQCWNIITAVVSHCSCLQELLDVTHLILGELEKEHKAQKAPGATAEAAKPDADADELREKFRIVRVSPLQPLSEPILHHELQ